MEIYFISTQDDFSKSQITRLNILGNVIFCDSLEKFLRSGVLKSKRDKIVAIRPTFCNYTFTNEIMDNISNLKGICLYTANARYVDLSYCRAHGIVVCNAPDYATDAIAEYMYFLALCCLKKLPIQIKYGKQEFSDIMLQGEMKNKKIGIIGLGKVGRKVAEMCNKNGNRIFYYSLDKYTDEYRMIGLQELFTNCDIIFSLLPIDDTTRGLITDNHLLSMKKNAIFVSGTGPFIHNHALLCDMVSKGKIFGYALEEPNKTINDYEGNVMVTSEYAWFTEEAKTKRKDIMIDCIESIIAGSPKNRLV